jgi:hypothetical protein
MLYGSEIPLYSQLECGRYCSRFYWQWTMTPPQAELRGRSSS